MAATTVDGEFDPTEPATTGARIRTPWVDVLGAWVTARVLVAAGFAVAHGIASTIPGVRFLHLDEGLLTWDGTWYRSLAEHGYAGTAREGLRFFPLYHLLAQLLSFGRAADLALLVISNGAALGCLVLLHRLVREQFDDEALARRSVWLMAVFPAAGSFVFAYSESLMLLLTLAIYLAVRRGSWWWVAAAGVAAGLSRPVAVLLCAPLAIAALRGWRSAAPAGRVARVLATASPALGVASYLWWVQLVHGDWTLPIDEQREIRKGIQDPFSRLAEAAWHVVTDSQLDAPALGFAVLFLALLVVCGRRQPAEWTLYAGLSVLVAVSAPVIDSTGRYGLVAFPLVVALAGVMRDDRSMWATAAVSGAGLLGLTVMTLLGGYIP